MATRKATKTTTKKAATKKAPSKKTASKKAASKKAASKKSATKKAASRKTASKKTAPKKAARRVITPRKALSNTRKLLAEKQQHARETPPWQQIGSTAGQGHDGFQSPEAAAQAKDLHAAEVRMEGNHGSISTHDRHAQGRRDSR